MMSCEDRHCPHRDDVSDWPTRVLSKGQRQRPKRILEDAAQNDDKPHVHLYTAGFPCQPFSYFSATGMSYHCRPTESSTLG